MANYRLSVTLEPMGYGRVETPSLSRALAVELVPALKGAPGPQGPQGPEGPPGPGSSWGAITGTLTDQSDLQAALAGKAAAAHSHTAAEISDSSAAGRTLLTAADASAQRTALNVADGATANSPDATLLDRSNHIGMQAQSTVTGLEAALAGRAAAFHTHTAAEISDSSIAGRALLTAVDASAQRAALGAQPLDGDLTALAETTGTNTLYYRSGPDTWSPVTIGANLSFSGGTLASTGGASGLADGSYGDIDVSGGGTSMTVGAASANTFYVNDIHMSGGNPVVRGANMSFETLSPVFHGTFNFGGGGSNSGVFKTINIGPGGLSGSTTDITIGSDVSGALGTLTINTPTVTFGTQVTSVSMASAAVDVGHIRLQELGSDPGSMTSGRLWYDVNTGHLKFHSGGRSKVIDNQLDVPFLVPPTGEYLLTTAGAGGAAAATLAGAAGRVDLFPYLPREDIAINQLVVNCTTAVASAQGKIVVYGSDANGRADGLLLETGVLDFGTTGVKVATVNLTLKKGEVYWLGVRHSSTATLSAWATTSTPDINGGTAISTSARKVLRRTLTFANAAPAAWGFTSAEINPGPATAIWMRLA